MCWVICCSFCVNIYPLAKLTSKLHHWGNLSVFQKTFNDHYLPYFYTKLWIWGMYFFSHVVHFMCRYTRHLVFLMLGQMQQTNTGHMVFLCRDFLCNIFNLFFQSRVVMQSNSIQYLVPLCWELHAPGHMAVFIINSTYTIGDTTYTFGYP